MEALQARPLTLGAAGWCTPCGDGWSVEALQARPPTLGAAGWVDPLWLGAWFASCLGRTMDSPWGGEGAVCA